VTLAELIFQEVCRRPGDKASDIAARLHIERRVVNQILYHELADKVRRDAEYRWFSATDNQNKQITQQLPEAHRIDEDLDPLLTESDAGSQYDTFAEGEPCLWTPNPKTLPKLQRARALWQRRRRTFVIVVERALHQIGRIEVEATSGAEAEDIAIKMARSEDVCWETQGLGEPHIFAIEEWETRLADEGG
jgi:hypothetical protein